MVLLICTATFKLLLFLLPVAAGLGCHHLASTGSDVNNKHDMYGCYKWVLSVYRNPNNLQRRE